MEIKDFACKAAENAARLAALFHLFSGKIGEINTEDMERDIALETLIEHQYIHLTKAGNKTRIELNPHCK